MKIENAFDVPAPPATAWELLNDVPRVVPCMPGAQLDEVVDADTIKVTLHVKLGAVAFRLATDVEREVSDATGLIAVLVADARDQKGRGGATATIRSSLEPLGTGTRVCVEADVLMRGTLASMGRGVVGAVATELVSRFADQLAAELATDRSGGAPAPALADGRASNSLARDVTGADAAPVAGLRLVLRAVVRRLWQRLRRSRPRRTGAVR